MNYPNNIKRGLNTNKSFSNRGMSLESDINITNEYYLVNNIGIIYKKPIPIQITKVDYPSRDKAVIKEAFYKVKSTTDYNGIYKGFYIDFEAKETKNLNQFPKNNLHEHQLSHLKKVDEHGGIAFVIIRFTRLNETFLIFINDLVTYYEFDKKSFVTYDYIREKGYFVKEGYNKRVDYLDIIDKLLLKEN